jgi:hypothetical protein
MLTWIKGLLSTTPKSAVDSKTDVLGLGGDFENQLVWLPEPRTQLVRRGDQSLTALRIGSPALRRRLSLAGINTIGELASSEPKQLRSQNLITSRNLHWLTTARRVSRLYLQLRLLRIVDARLLIAVHRGRKSTIGCENAVRLHRDLNRFIVSTAGQQVLGRKKPPTLADVESWVQACQKNIATYSSHINEPRK